MRGRAPGANGKQFLATLRKRFCSLLFGLLKMFCCLCDRMAFNQNIFAAEFIMRIASFRRVAVSLHAVVKIENLSGIAKRFVDFFFAPDVERAFGGLLVTGITDPGYNWAVGVFGGEEAAFL